MRLYSRTGEKPIAENSKWMVKGLRKRDANHRQSTALNRADLSSREMLALHACAAGELRARCITRSANNPRGDRAEFLFYKAFGWKQVENSHPNVDEIRCGCSREVCSVPLAGLGALLQRWLSGD